MGDTPSPFVDEQARTAADGVRAAAAPTQEQLAAILSIASDAIITLDATQRITFFNEGAERTFGYTAAEVLGRHLDVLIPERFRGGHRGHVRRFGESSVVSRRMGERLEIAALRKGGEEFPAEASISKLESDGVLLFSVVLRDITERKEAEAQARQLVREQAARLEAEAAAGRLRESEARFRTMADTAPVLIWTAGTDGRCDWFNRPWLEFTGRTLEQEAGDGWAAVHPDDRPRCLELYRSGFERREPYRMQYRLRRHDGQYRWVLEHGVPRFTPEGEFAGYLGSCMDLHEHYEQQRALERNAAHLEQVTSELEQTVDELQLRTAEEQVARTEAEEARRTAEEASRAKSQFLAVMSHELRTPLNAILGFADLLDGEIAGPLNARQREQLSRIRASSWHLLELINQLLSLSRIEAGKEDVHVSDVDVATLCLDTARLIEPAAEQKGLSLHVRVAESPLAARTDAGKLRQILLNLLNNAVKFTESGELELGVERRDGWIRLSVRDTGIGIPADHHERIFEPFAQVDPSSPRGRGGTGLGLSVTRELTHLLGGDVSLTSEPGLGSTFVVRLPRQLELTG